MAVEAGADPGLLVIAGALKGRADLLEQAIRKLRPVHFSGQVLPQMLDRKSVV